MMEEETSWVESIMNFIMLGIFIGVVAWIFRSCQAEKQQCLHDHGGKPYTVESLFGHSSGGCDVIKMEQYNGECYRDGYVYLTDCEGVSWDEQSGKHTERRSSVNE